MISTSSQITLEEKLQRVRGTRQSNCIGTALYLAGLQEEDTWCDTSTAYEKFLKDLPVTPDPVRGSLIAWTKNISGVIITSHMGVVTSVDGESYRITHRESGEGELKEDETFQTANRLCDYPKPGIVLRRGFCSKEVVFYDIKIA